MLFSHQPLFSVSYETEPNDLINSQYRINLAPKQKKARWLSVVIFSFAILIITLAASNENGKYRFYEGGTAFVVIFLLLTYLLIIRNSGRHLRTKIERKLAQRYHGGIGTAGLVGQRTFSIYENGLGMLTDSDFSQNQWNSLTTLFLLEDAIVIFNTPATFYELPKAKLGDEKFNQAVTLLREKAPPNCIRLKFDFPL